jgi:RNA polymerase sigma-70 factor (ECF subfamily)
VGLSSAAVLEAVEHRRELTGYCTRMLGSGFDADDAVQETMVRAWTRRETFEGRSSVHSWLYRIATNVCLDMLRSQRRRAVPTDLDLDAVEPATDDRRLPAVDPAEVAAAREAVRCALVAALRELPPRQRSVLILREVLRWSAPEVADLLGTSVASVNSALQRARAALAARGPDPDTVARPADARQEALLTRYAVAFERYDMSSLVALLHQEATGR